MQRIFRVAMHWLLKFAIFSGWQWCGSWRGWRRRPRGCWWPSWSCWWGPCCSRPSSACCAACRSVTRRPRRATWSTAATRSSPPSSASSPSLLDGQVLDLDLEKIPDFLQKISNVSKNTEFRKNTKPKVYVPKALKNTGKCGTKNTKLVTLQPVIFSWSETYDLGEPRVLVLVGFKLVYILSDLMKSYAKQL